MTEASNAAQRDVATDHTAVMTPGMTLFFAAAVAVKVLNLFASQPLLALSARLSE